MLARPKRSLSRIWLAVLRTFAQPLAIFALLLATAIAAPVAEASEPPEGYGRLLVIGNHDTTQVEINGTAYPYEWVYGDMEGVFLPADRLLEIVVSAGDDSRRTFRFRLDDGETRVLVVDIENQGAAPARASRPRPVERDDDEEEEEEEEVGYLGVSSSPRGIVYVDQAETDSRTPARRIALEPGRHEVQVYYDEEDVMSEVKHVLIRAGVNTNVFFRLRREQLEADE